MMKTMVQRFFMCVKHLKDECRVLNFFKMLRSSSSFSFSRCLNVLQHVTMMTSHGFNAMREICCKLSKSKVIVHGAHESSFNNDICFVIKFNNEAKFNYYATQDKTKIKTKHEWKLIQHRLSMLLNIESTVHRQSVKICIMSNKL